MTPYEDKYLSEIEDYIGFEIRREDAPSKRDAESNRIAFVEKINTKPVTKKDKE